PWLWGKTIFPEDAYQTGFSDTAFIADPLVIEAFQARQDIIWKHHFMPDPIAVDAFGGGSLFEMQKVAMQVTGGWGWWEYRNAGGFDWAVAALPYGAPGRKAVVFSAPWLLSSQSR